MAEPIKYPLPINRGGTGAAERSQAFSNLAPPNPLSNDLIIWDGTEWILSSSAGVGIGLKGSIGATFSNFNSPVEIGANWSAVVPYAWSLTGVRFIADQVGDLAITISTQPFSTYSIGGWGADIHTAAPTMVANDQYEDTTLTGYTVSFPAHTCVRFYVRSVSGINSVRVVLNVAKG